ncbi:hypothetical protein ACFV19_15295 [Streptomyces griseoluteus]|uniref:hypothetical protein n=1 Tax=Streptomyces griseoluteus TaxID=29306 RepID=UPI0036A8CBB9
MNLMDVIATLTEYGLMGLAGFGLFLICLLALLLGAIIAVGHLVRPRQMPDAPETQTPHLITEGSALASFRWEVESDQEN